MSYASGDSGKGPADGLWGREMMPPPADSSQGVRQPVARRKNRPCAPRVTISRQTGNLYFNRCFPMFQCWQMSQIICPTLQANPNRSKGQIKGSGCQLVDLRSRPPQDHKLPAGSGPALSSGRGKYPILVIGQPGYCTASGRKIL